MGNFEGSNFYNFFTVNQRPIKIKPRKISMLIHAHAGILVYALKNWICMQSVAQCLSKKIESYENFPLYSNYAWATCIKSGRIMLLLLWSGYYTNLCLCNAQGASLTNWSTPLLSGSQEGCCIGGWTWTCPSVVWKPGQYTIVVYWESLMLAIFFYCVCHVTIRWPWSGGHTCGSMRDLLHGLSTSVLTTPTLTMTSGPTSSAWSMLLPWTLMPLQTHIPLKWAINISRFWQCECIEGMYMYDREWLSYIYATYM